MVLCVWANLIEFWVLQKKQLQMLLEAMNSHFSVPETGRHHSVHQEACEVTIFDFQATHGQSVGAPTNVRGVLLPVGFSTGPKSRSTCAWPKPQSRHCLAKFGKAGVAVVGACLICNTRSFVVSQNISNQSYSMSLQLRSPGTISLPASFSSWKITRNRSMYVSSSLRTRHLRNAGNSHGPRLSQSKHDMKSGAHSKYRA